MPRQFSFRGDRLAYSWGIVLLAAIAFSLLWAFGGDTHALIPLYSVGVFVCFTLSQIGMVRHWLTRARVRLALADGRQRARGRPDRRGARGGRLREVPGRRLPRGDPRPDARRDDAVHQPPVQPLEARAGREPGPDRPRRSIARSAWSSRSRASTGPSSRPSTSPARSATTSGRSTSPTTRSWRRACAPNSSGPIPGRARSSSSSRRTARSPVRCSPTSTCSTPRGPRASWSRSRSWSSPSTWPARWWERILYNQASKRLRTVLLGRPHTVVVNVPYRREEKDLLRPRPSARTRTSRA